MITVRRSKVELMQAFQAHMLNRPPRDSKDLELLMRYLNESLELRKDLIVNENFTEEEYTNTLNAAKFLDNEEYEKLIGYKIIED